MLDEKYSFVGPTTLRTIDIMKFQDGSFDVNLMDPLESYYTDQEIAERIDNIFRWCEVHCEGPYIILMQSVMFKLETDALIFKLKFGI